MHRVASIRADSFRTWIHFSGVGNFICIKKFGVKFPYNLAQVKTEPRRDRMREIPEHH